MGLSDLQADLGRIQTAIEKAEKGQSWQTGQYSHRMGDLSALYAERRRLRGEIARLGGDPENPPAPVSYGSFVRR